MLAIKACNSVSRFSFFASSTLFLVSSSSFSAIVRSSCSTSASISVVILSHVDRHSFVFKLVLLFFDDASASSSKFPTSVSSSLLLVAKDSTSISSSSLASNKASTSDSSSLLLAAKVSTSIFSSLISALASRSSSYTVGSLLFFSWLSKLISTRELDRFLTSSSNDSFWADTFVNSSVRSMRSSSDFRTMAAFSSFSNSSLASRSRMISLSWLHSTWDNSIFSSWTVFSASISTHVALHLFIYVIISSNMPSLPIKVFSSKVICSTFSLLLVIKVSTFFFSLSRSALDDLSSFART